MNKMVVGVDIGGTNTVLGLVDAEGNIHGEQSFKTKGYPFLDDYIEQILCKTELLLHDTPDAALVGIGIGAPNGNHLSGAMENPVNVKLYERLRDGSQGEAMEIVPLVAELRKKFPSLVVALDNDANAAAAGELIYGGARGMRDFIEVTLGTGVGGGVVVNGEMVYGHGGTATELGHIVIRRGGRLCGCGRRGCLEAYASASGVVRTMVEILTNDHRPSVLRDVSLANIGTRIMAEAAEQGDLLALEAFDQTAEVLGEAFADFVAFSFPEAIFVGGGVAKAGGLLLEPTKRYMELNMLRNYKGKVQLLPSGVDVAVLGASALAWKELHR